MIDPKDLVPLRWPADAAWQNPEMLSLVKGSPVNCIVAPADWKLREQAERAGLRVMTLTASELVTVGKLDAKHSGIAALANCKFPRVPAEGKGNEDSDTAAASGPTGNPWVDSNGWKVALARAKAPGAAVWVDAPTPKSGAVLRPENYILAVTDAAAYGGRWIVQFDADLAKGIAARNDTAMATAHALRDALRFFEERKAWASYPPVARLGVLSDFEGPNEYLGTEVLLLAGRRLLPNRAVYKDGSADLAGLKAILLVDQREPEGAWKAKLDTFVQNGGTLIVAASNAHMAQGLPATGVFDGRYGLYKAGSGRVAVARKPWKDPYQLATDAHLLLGRQHDVIRMWNGGSVNVQLTEAPQGSAVVQVLNYAARQSGTAISMYVARPYKSAKWWTVGAQEPQTVALVEKNEGVEFNLPAFSSYGVIELGA